LYSFKGQARGKRNKKTKKIKAWVLTDILLHWAIRRRRSRRRRRRRQQQQGFFFSLCFLLLPKGSGFESKSVPVSVLGSLLLLLVLWGRGERFGY
jgi:hypothetical protein